MSLYSFKKKESELKKMVAERIRQEFTGWKVWEWAWMIFSCAVIAGVSLYLKDNWLGILSAVTGTLYALFAGKGKISCYFFGIINSALYGWISYTQTLYGEVMLNWGYYFPMMFVGLFFWRKHLDENKEIYKEKLGLWGRILLVVLSLLAVIIYEWVLYHMGDKQSLLDSTTTVLSVSAMVMTVKRCIEQWILWIIVNFISIYMWYQVYLAGGPGASLLMWIVALCNSFIFLYQWTKEVKPCPAKTIQQ